MKKKLQEEIKDLAKELLASEDSFQTTTVKKTVARLYERLSVLQYLESQLEDDTSPQVVPSEALDSKSFREVNWFTEPEPVLQPEHKEDLIEPLMEKIKDIVAQMPEESQRIDDMLEEVLPKKKYMKNDLEEFAATYQQTPTFERKDSTNKSATTQTNTLEEKQPAKGGDIPKKDAKLVDEPITSSNRPKSINDIANSGLSIGLNDRLAFIKHLFNNKTEDYTRVLSQISTMRSYEEAASFIKAKVKPDYNYWLQKEEYADRFMNIVEKSFN